MELLHKLEAVLFLSFLLLLLLPALMVCAPCYSIHTLHTHNMTNTSQPEPKEQKVCRIHTSQSSVRAWTLPVVAIMKPVFLVFSLGHFIAKMTSNIKTLDEVLFLRCKRFPGWIILVGKSPSLLKFLLRHCCFKVNLICIGEDWCCPWRISIGKNVLQSLNEVNSKW